MMLPADRWRKSLPGALLLTLVATFAGLLHDAITTNELTIDEVAHLPAGISYWDLGRFYLYRVNPPFVQGLAALPAWLSGAKMDYSRAGAGSRSEWNVGLDFLQANPEHVRRYFARARSVIVLMSIACGLLIYRWASELYGRAAGAVGATLWFLDPNVLAHSALVTTDVGAAAFGCLATYAYWHFLRDPTTKKALLAGVALGLAQGTKFSLLVLYPTWLVLAILARLPSTHAPARPRPTGLRLGLIFVVSLLTLNALYNFDGTFTPLGSFAFRSEALTGQRWHDVASPRFGNCFRDTPLAGIPVPLPKGFLVGLDTQKWEGEIGFMNLEGGRLVRNGHWYSPFLTLGRKLPLGTLLILAASGIVCLVDLRRPRLGSVVLLLPIVLMFGMICSQIGLNWVVRYALIAFPFLFIATGRFVQVAWGQRLPRLFLLACVLVNVVGLARTRPFYLSYGNELIGGTAGAQRVFVGSNFDWGQDLLRLKEWCDGHPAIASLAVSYYGIVDPKPVGLQHLGLPMGLFRSADVVGSPSGPGPTEPFYWAISSNILNGIPGRIVLEDGTTFLGAVDSPRLKPENAIARIGSTIYVFRIEPDTRVRSDESGIPFGELAGCVHRHEGDTLYTSP